MVDKNRILVKPLVSFVLIFSILTSLFPNPIANAIVNFAGGEGTLSNPFLINTPEQLNDIRNHLDKHFRLDADINLNGYANWVPIPRFKGSLDGNGFTISNLKIDRKSTNDVGLFSVAEMAMDQGGGIYNLNMKNVQVFGNFGVGSLVGRVYSGTISNVHVDDVEIQGENNGIGGLIGHIDDNTTIIDSSATNVSVSGNDHVGGLTGRNSGAAGTSATVEYSYTSGSVFGRRNHVGGLMGSLNKGSVSHSHSTVHVRGNGQNVGGLIGIIDAGQVLSSHATGDVHSANSTAGGLVGTLVLASIKDSFATGKANGAIAGGLVGTMTQTNGLIEHSYATGDVTGTAWAGGLVGTMSHFNTLIEHSYATGDVTANSSAGGLVGHARGKITHSYAGGKVHVLFKGTVTSGGLVGELTGGEVGGGLIQHSYAYGDVYGFLRVGGLVGTVANGRIEHSWALQNLLQKRTEGDYEGVALEMGRIVGRGNPVLVNNRAYHAMVIDQHELGSRDALSNHVGQDGLDVDTEVKVAEDTEMFTDIYAAYQGLQDIPYDPVRQELVDRLEQLQAIDFTLEPVAETIYTNDKITIQGTARAYQVEALTVEAAFAGIERSIVLGSPPLEAPEAPNVNLVWDVQEDTIAEGTYHLPVQVYAETTEGKSVTVPWNPTVVVDTTAPLLTIKMKTDDEQTYLSGESTHQPVTVTASVYDTNSGVERVQYSADGGTTWAEYDDSQSLTFDQTGTYELHLVALDRAGNRSESVLIINVTIEKPIIMLIKPDQEQIGSATASFTISAKVWNEGGEPVEVSATMGGQTKSMSLDPPPAAKPQNANVTLSWSGTELPEGKYQSIEIVAEGEYGGSSTALYTGSIIVDKTSPGLEVTLLKEDGNLYTQGSITEQDVTVTAQVYDDLSGINIVRYQLNDEDWKALNGSIVLNKNGHHTLRIEAEDRAGNLSQRSEATIQINNQIPVITLQGDNPLYWPIGKPFDEPGYSAWSNYYGDLSDQVTVTGNVYSSGEGRYHLYYDVMDPVGLQAEQARRIVIVYNPDSIFLSFDESLYTLPVGESIQTVVEAVYGDGNPAKLTGPIHYSSLQPGIASIDSVGKIVAHGAGKTKLLAEYDGVFAEANVEVIHSPGGGGDGGSRDPEDDSATIDHDNDGKSAEEQSHVASGYLIQYLIDGTRYTRSIEDIEDEVHTEQNQFLIEIVEQGEHISVVLDDELVKSLFLSMPSGDVHVRNQFGSYMIPLAELQAMATEGSSITISIQKTIEETKTTLEQLMIQQGANLLGTPLKYALIVTDENDKVTVHEEFNQYTTRSILLEGNIDSALTTVVLYEPEQRSFVPVPTFVRIEQGQTEVNFYRKGNSIYAIVQQQQVKTFPDLQEHWAKEEVERLASKFILKGVSEHQFAPDRSINRAEFTAMIVRALGLTPINEKSSFADIPMEEWYAGIVNTAVNAGLILGYSDQTFRPNQEISRQEMAVIIERALAYVHQSTDIVDETSVLSHFRDRDEISQFARAATAHLVKSEIITGRSVDRFAPHETVTRAEAAVMMYRMLKYLEFIN